MFVPANPPTREILERHELASRTISQHDTDAAIFDDEELHRLKRFVMDPTPQTQREILRELDAEDPEGVAPDRIGSAAAEKGSLAAFVIARYGRVDGGHHTLDASEVDALKSWFLTNPRM